MKIITFRTHPSAYYTCSEPNNQSGEYVSADTAREVLAALERASGALAEIARADDLTEEGRRNKARHHHAALAPLLAALETDGAPC